MSTPPQSCHSAEVFRFYRVNDAYGEFSNFAAFPIDLDGTIWPTSERNDSYWPDGGDGTGKNM